MVTRHSILLLFAFLIAVSSIGISAQETPFEWKLFAKDLKSTVDKGTGLRLYTLEQGVLAAFTKYEAADGVIVVLPGDRFNNEERMQYFLRGTDPDRVLTAMAVAIVLPMPADADAFFVSKEKLKDRFIYRWK